jgi:serine phosphatase RsbU (regulator of sigma subunit)
VHVILGDVSGHGPDEAAIAVALHIAWRALVFAGFDGAALLRVLDAVLRSERRAIRTFASVMSVVCTPEHSTVTTMRAGHPGMLLHGPAGVRWIEPRHGPVLGLTDNAQWPEDTFELPVGHGLALLTDGMFEGYAGMGNERLGEAGLLAIAQPIRALPGQQFVEALMNSVERRAETHGGITDDIAIVRLRRLSPGAPKPARCRPDESRTGRDGQQ